MRLGRHNGFVLTSLCASWFRRHDTGRDAIIAATAGQGDQPMVERWTIVFAHSRVQTIFITNDEVAQFLAIILLRRAYC